MTALFSTGNIAATPTVLKQAGLELITECLMKHISGNWGVVCADSKTRNDEAVMDCDRIVSAYQIGENQDDKLLIITEADRSYTTVLLTEEY